MTIGRRGAALGTGLGLGAGLGAVGMGAVGVGWFYSNVLIGPAREEVYPERVLAAGGGTVTLAPSRLVLQPGVWGLRWAAGLAVVGPVVHRDRDAVVRVLRAGPVPGPGTPAILDAGPWDPDPGARGLAFDEVAVPTPLGPAPAWSVPADGDVWVVAVHGRGSSRREVLRVLPALHSAGHPVLAITYRNDEGAPPSPDGRHHLGDTEWEDVEAAVRYALAHGARAVALLGWSMGGALTGAFLDRSPLAAHVTAVVWDAPLVDWRATLRQQARIRRLPPALTRVAAAITSRRIGIDFDRFDLRARPPAVRPPTLVVHSTADTAVPVSASRALAAAAAGLGWPMRYLEVADVEHTAAWNADPDAYERAVVAFLREHTAPPSPDGTFARS